MRAQRGGSPQIVSPPGLSLSSRVHEYGGGAYCLLEGADGVLVVGVRGSDQAMVAFHPLDAEVSVIVADQGAAFGDLSPGPSGCVVGVRERRVDGDVERDVVLIDAAEGRIDSLVAHRDFFSDPRVAQDGRMVWCAWDHPAMPWDGSEVWSGRLVDADGGYQVGDLIRVDGRLEQPASCPVLLPDRSVVFVAEHTDRAQLWRWSPEAGVAQLSDGRGEVGQPLWILGTTSVAVVGGSETVACVMRQDGRSEVAVLNEGSLEVVDAVPGAVCELVTTSTGIGVLGNGHEHLGYVAWLDEGQPVEWRALGPQVPGPVSRAEPITVTSDDGREVHGLIYGPHSPTSSPPPVVVFCHGGPTGQALAGLNPLIEALTSRGLCVVAANYSGSTGFGAGYRHRLDGRWGVADVEDCVALVGGLSERGLIDGTRAAIRGTSAGGLTALLGLTTGAFRGAVSWYGVADLVTLAQSTHDFESCYLDRLVGPLPAALEVYVERSPVNRAQEMKGAALLLQGLDDPVVPPDQAAAMTEALRSNGHAVELIEFPGESHGFRRLDTIESAFRAEVEFYERHLMTISDAGSIGRQ